MSTAKDKARVLAEALPYIRRFHGKIIVVKYGGNAMINEELKTAVIKDLILMQLVGMKPIIVHGGGPEINLMLERLAIESSFVDGLRITDENVMEVVEMVLVGKVNPEIIRHINSIGGNAVGLSGKDGRLLLCEKKQSETDLGLVGEIKKVNTELLYSLMEKDYMPVVAPIGVDKEGHSYNINADDAASKIASALNAERLILLTNVTGIKGRKDYITYLNVADVPQLIEDGIISGGMIPKVNCCIDAIEGGVGSTHILDGRVEHSVLLELFTNEGIGTMVGHMRQTREGRIPS